MTLRVHAETPPDLLTAQGVSWPLLTYDTLALKIATDAFLEWWPQFAGLTAFSPSAVAEWDALWAPVWVRGLPKTRRTVQDDMALLRRISRKSPGFMT